MLIYSQCHGCMPVVGLQNLLPVLRMVLAQAVNPPPRMVPAGQRIAVRLRHQRITLSQKATQAGIDERCLRLGSGVALGGFDCLVNQGEGIVRGGIRIPAKRQRRAQQGIYGRARRAGGELAAQHFGTPHLPQHMEQQRLHTWAQGRLHGGQGGCARLAAANGCQGARHTGQLLPQCKGLCSRWRRTTSGTIDMVGTVGRRGAPSSRTWRFFVGVVTHHGPMSWHANPMRP